MKRGRGGGREVLRFPQDALQVNPHVSAGLRPEMPLLCTENGGEALLDDPASSK